MDGAPGRQIELRFEDQCESLGRRRSIDRTQDSDVCECHISAECGTLRRVCHAKITIPVGAFYDGRERRRGLIAVEVVAAVKKNKDSHSVVVTFGRVTFFGGANCE